MIESLKHENWYRVDEYQDASCGIARIHLGIFNPQSQPTFNEDNSLLIFFDGKIYGYEKELDMLKEKGHTFRLDNDPEFCLHSYEEGGKDFVRNLNGNFVLVICDPRDHRVIVANDRFGFRVHYYALNDGRLLLAPEPKAILEDRSFKRELNEDAVAEFFAFGESWGHKTFFKGIQVLPPATVLTYEDGKTSLENYWRLEYHPDYAKSEDEFIEELISRLKHAVDIRMKDELRHGVTLSGGLDSRTIIANVDPERRSNVTAITFGSPDCDEVRLARYVVEKARLKNHLILEATPDLIIENAERDIFLTDGRLFLGLSFVNPMFKCFREEVDVIFDGFALDLTLGGSYLTKDKIESRDKEELLGILSQRRIFTDGNLYELFTPAFHERVRDVPMRTFHEEFDKAISDRPDNLSDEFAMNTHVAWMHIGDVAVRNELEVSHPTSDNYFVGIIEKIPPEWRLNHYLYRKFLIRLSPDLAKIPYDHTMIRADAPLAFWRLGAAYLKGKEFLKKMIWKYSGKRIFLPNKHSYVNFDEWFRMNERWRNHFKELLLKYDGRFEEFINPGYVSRLLEEEDDARRSNAMKLLHIASFKLFLRQYF